jgi:uncharacterized PurR-regulated membrane protein YhhQ (DUF165 family)
MNISSYESDIQRKLIFILVLFHTFIITLSNYLVTIRFELFDLKLTLAAFTFPLIVVATDLTTRILNQEIARRIVAISFIPAITLSILIIYYIGAPGSVAVRIGIASGCAYFISNLVDVYMFQKVREKMILWFWAPAISCIFANIIDTFTFFFIAFYNSENSYMANNWFVIAWGQASVKIIVSLIVTLPIYGILLACFQHKIHKKFLRIVSR